MVAYTGTRPQGDVGEDSGTLPLFGERASRDLIYSLLSRACALRCSCELSAPGSWCGIEHDVEAACQCSISRQAFVECPWERVFESDQHKSIMCVPLRTLLGHVSVVDRAAVQF